MPRVSFSKHKKARKKPAATRRPAKRTAKKAVRKNTKHARLLRAVRLARARAERVERKPAPELHRHESNPIIEPRQDLYWEMKATFNPGALYADRRVHLLYRAIGGDDISVLGYASSSDGINIDERLPEPVFVPVTTKYSENAVKAKLPEVPYMSGGGWNGGCEDPRLTLIDDTVYLTYTAFDGWGSIRLALSSISLDDFLSKKWSWKKPALISPPGEIHKNWVLFPEKIHGKFAILHSIAPKILIDYFDALEDFDEEETVIRGSVRKMEVEDPDRWEMLVRGAGPPPIKTKDGWLVFYHAVERRDPGKYKLGAMVLDADDPTKVLYRSLAPILEPDAYYENNGKWGIVYSCGAVVKDGELYVYYGGADAVTCVAMASLDKFLDDLKKYGTPKLEQEVKPKIPNVSR